MIRRRKVSTRKNITRRRNTFNNCNFKEGNNMKYERIMTHEQEDSADSGFTGVIYPDWDI